MFRTHNCGELSVNQKGEKVTLSGWAQTIRNKGFIIWIDLRDRYGITQLVFDNDRTSKDVYEKAKLVNREYVVQINGVVLERESKNPEIETGSIEIFVEKLNILNKSETPPFTIEDKTDGGEGIQLLQKSERTAMNVESSNAHSTSLVIFKSASTSSTGATLYVQGTSSTGGTKVMHVANNDGDIFATYANGSIHCTGPILSNNGTDTVNARLPVRDSGGTVVNTT